MDTKDELIHKLKQLRVADISTNDFRKWFIGKNDIEKIISRGFYLKLKKNDFKTMMHVLCLLSPSCNKCGNLYKIMVFENRKQQLKCLESIEIAEKQKTLIWIDKPYWYIPKDNQLGAEAFYKCNHCGAIWNLVEPEKQYNGLWNRVA